ncbi:MAG: pimeloyl-ACP methyl ester carboxylesterase [Paraglaciecola sp.]|jgi:pimeloyl-ACP methyl ester carboxylesterase
MPIEHNYVDVEGINIHYVEAQPDDARGTLVFLHGFPEHWATWQAQLDYFSEHYRVIAPDLPGYNLSDKPQATEFFQVANLIRILATFIQTVVPDEKVYLIAHDWGGAIAWPLTAFYPRLFEKLIILNAAHPSLFTREMIHNPLQRQKSEYIHELIAQDAVKHLSANHFAYLRNLTFAGMRPGTLDTAKKLAYEQAWSQPGAVNGMLQYYRAMPQLAPSEKNNSGSARLFTSTTEMKIPNIRINVPTLILWGEQDQAFVLENIQGIEEYVADCRIKRFPHASHWLQHELPDEVNHEVATFIAQ